MSIQTKKPLNLSLPRAIRERVADGKQLSGQRWPVSVVSVDGAIVTVAFEVASDFTLPQVTCPIAESYYVRIPVQVGDKGYVGAADARLGGVTGLGAGLAPLSEPANLGGLVYYPLGNKAWSTLDPNAVVIRGPNGAVIRTEDGSSVVTLDTSHIDVQRGAITVVINDSGITITSPLTTIDGNLAVNGDVAIAGNLAITGSGGGPAAQITGSFNILGDVTMTGTVTINGIVFEAHQHTDVSTGSGDSGGVKV